MRKTYRLAAVVLASACMVGVSASVAAASSSPGTSAVVDADEADAVAIGHDF